MTKKNRPRSSQAIRQAKVYRIFIIVLSLIVVATMILQLIAK